MRGMFKELNQTVGKYAGEVSELKKQVSQIAKDVYESREEKGKLPSQTIPNPRPNLSVVTIKDDGYLSNEEKREELELVQESASATQTKDPGSFTVTCGIGNRLIPNCLVDLGASLNIMPYDIYSSMEFGPLKPAKFSIELGNKSCVRPLGLIENLTLNIGEVVVPADFYVLQMNGTTVNESPTLILGRPLLFATKAKIDVAKGSMRFEYGGRVAEFRVFDDDELPDAEKPPDIAGNVCSKNFVDASLCVFQGVGAQMEVTKKPRPPDKKLAKKLKCGVVARRSWRCRGENYGAKPPDGRLGIERLWSCQGATGKSMLRGKFDLAQPWDPNL